MTTPTMDALDIIRKHAGGGGCPLRPLALFGLRSTVPMAAYLLATLMWNLLPGEAEYFTEGEKLHQSPVAWRDGLYSAAGS